MAWNYWFHPNLSRVRCSLRWRPQTIPCVVCVCASSYEARGSNVLHCAPLVFRTRARGIKFSVRALRDTAFARRSWARALSFLGGRNCVFVAACFLFHFSLHVRPIQARPGEPPFFAQPMMANALFDVGGMVSHQAGMPNDGVRAPCVLRCLSPANSKQFYFSRSTASIVMHLPIFLTTPESFADRQKVLADGPP